MPLDSGGKTVDRKSDGTFAPGNSVGQGRPQGSRNKTTRAVEALLDGQAEALTNKAVEMALSGDGQALRLCLERLCPPRKSRPIEITLPDTKDASGVDNAMAVVVQAVASGEITPDEGTTLSAMLEARRKAIETLEFEKRLSRLEKAKGR